MPLAALTPLAIISGCLTVAGVGMHLNHWLFTGEVCGAPAGAGARAASAPRRRPAARTCSARPRCAALTPPSARCPLQWNRSDTDRWKEGLWSRDRLIKKGYIKQ